MRKMAGTTEDIFSIFLLLDHNVNICFQIRYVTNISENANHQKRAKI